MSASSSIASAGELADLIREVVNQELEKHDTVMVYTVYSRNDANDTYNLYLDIEYVSQDKQPNLIQNIPNASNRQYRVGDHVYVMRVRNQIAQSFIIGGAFYS